MSWQEQVFGKSYQDWLDKRSTTKNKLYIGAYTCIKKWYELEDIKFLNSCTFRYIVEFFENKPPNPRFKTACSDYGYSIEELTELKNSGKTAKDIAKEILDRSVNESDD